MSRLRVLHVIPDLVPGGAQRLVVDLLEAFDRERFEVAAVSLYAESGKPLEREARDKRLPVYYLNKHRGLDLGVAPQLYRLFRAYRPDVVHTHRYALRYALPPTILCRIRGRVHTLHNLAQREVDWMGKPIRWLAFRWGSLLPVCLCQETARSAQTLYGYGMRVAVVHNGIPTARFVSAGRPTSDQRRDITILHVGRFSPQKNHRLLIQAFAVASEELPGMQLWLVGDGHLRVPTEELVSSCRMQRRILFLGERTDVPALLSESDMFVLSSDYEGVPLSVLEAMAAGRPVVSTNVGGIPEIVDHGVTGLLVPPGEPQALAQAILLLARNPELRCQMGQAGQRVAIERFDIAQTARGYEALYLKLMSERGRA
ncbi:MAG: glycosyltransferase [Anaerolineales bacterium]|nr:MAG: glycosyltransferase [Anaerolineales bacterium]